jgi:hypothetical protein
MVRSGRVAGSARRFTQGMRTTRGAVWFAMFLAGFTSLTFTGLGRYPGFPGSKMYRSTVLMSLAKTTANF